VDEGDVGYTCVGGNVFLNVPEGEIGEFIRGIATPIHAVHVGRWNCPFHRKIGQVVGACGFNRPAQQMGIGRISGRNFQRDVGLKVVRCVYGKDEIKPSGANGARMPHETFLLLMRICPHSQE
jgi:hypothetical protein